MVQGLPQYPKPGGSGIVESMSDQENNGTETMPTPQTATATTPGVPAEARNWAVFTHLSAFAMFLGIPSIIGPVVMWAIKKEEDPFIDFHGKEAMNFNISFLIYGLVAAVSVLLVIGLVLLPAVFLTWFVLVIVATVKASAGEYYRYPLTIKFID